ncbi:MAG: Na/Pi cotransporter [Marinilabiliales bacterium]|nr:MAG: Na/Pi cotransporter [Marinilabiliales bacterium]
MEYGIYDLLKLIGSLVFFLFGMKLMSEGLQKVAGDKMRNILAAMTSNRIKGVFTGFLITSVIQSSSATTVMLVSFVNAGLITLLESIGVIMGANIGTTVTAWIISLLGFKVSISALSLPIIGLGFPLVFSKKNKRKSWGEFMVGFAIIFMGLDFLKASVPDIKNSPEILEFLSGYTEMGYVSIFIFLLIGTILTIVVQSSSATMALTLVMCSNGWIPFEMAAAMVLGENIGTTITANIAAAVANRSAKRTARAHLIFNLFGVIWMLLLFKFFLHGIDWFVRNYIGEQSPFESVAAIPISLSIFHSSFNILNTLVMVWFARFIQRVVEKLVPVKEDDDEDFSLSFISTGMLSTSELSLLQARKEIALYGKRAKKMFINVQKLFNEVNDKKFEKKFEKILQQEENMDKIEIEIAHYLTKIQQGEISSDTSRRIRAMLKVIDDMESMGDTCHAMAKAVQRKREQKLWFPQDLRNNVNEIFEMVIKSLDIMLANLDLDYKNADLSPALELETEINELRNKFRDEHIEKFKRGEYKYLAGVVYMDLVTHAEYMGDFVINVSEAVCGDTAKKHSLLKEDH